MEFRRKIYEKLNRWKNTENGKTALLIEGARRVGKTFAIETFAKSAYKSYIKLDFSNISQEVIDMFSRDSYKLDVFFQKLSAFYGVKLYRRESLILFDEVQLYPQARQLIKHLVADGRYDYIETGSLISLRENVEGILIPSEEDHLNMYPLDFEEFLWNLEEEQLAEYIRKCYLEQIPLGQGIHRKAMNLFRQYLLVGGMPQSMLAYMEEKDFSQSDVVKRRILQLYKSDVGKYAKSNANKVRAIFDDIPSQLSKHEKKFVLRSLSKDAKFRNYKDAFGWLDEAMIANICVNATDPSIGLTLNAERTTLKCYLGDTGLLVSQILADNIMTDNDLYKAVLFDRIGLNEGMLMENVVAQMLTANGHKLFFYSRNDRDIAANRMEVDFLLRHEKKIVGIEVKSSNYTSHSSLDKFKNKFGSKIGKGVIINTKDLVVKDDLLYIPIYMGMCL